MSPDNAASGGTPVLLETDRLHNKVCRVALSAVGSLRDPIAVKQRQDVASSQLWLTEVGYCGRGQAAPLAVGNTVRTSSMLAYRKGSCAITVGML